MSVESELWNVFTYYSLITNPLDPEHMSQQQWVKFLKHCRIVKSRKGKLASPSRSSLRAASRGGAGTGRTISAAAAAVYYTREVTRRDRHLTDPVKKMNYDDFLNALMRIAHEKLYSEQMRVDESFQELLIKNVLPFDHALRRKPDYYMQMGPPPLSLPDFSVPIVPPVAETLVSDPLLDLKSRYGRSLKKIFLFYGAGQSRHKAHDRRATSPNVLAYKDFVRFGTDFSMTRSCLLTTVELGDVFLTCARSSSPTTNMRRLTFDEFWEAVVRCALVAYSDMKLQSRKAPTKAVGFHTFKVVSPADKLRNMFLFMWRTINNNVPRALGMHAADGTYTANLITGAQEFSSAFVADWKQKDFCDYLRDADTEELPARQVLRGLLRGGGRAAAPAAAPAMDDTFLGGRAASGSEAFRASGGGRGFDLLDGQAPPPAPLYGEQDFQYSGSREQLAEVMRARGDL
jgi:hypothetical protein